MTFITLPIATFSNVELFRASDTKGGGWNEYGVGHVHLNFIQDCDEAFSNCKGKGQLTFHNELTRAGGINMMIVKNLPVHLDVIDNPRRLTFKALSRTIGNNGLTNMYSMRFDSSENAARLWHLMFTLQFVAKQANVGQSLDIPSPISLEATTARALLGTDQEDVDRFLIIYKLVELVAANPDEFSSPSHQWAEVFFGAPLNISEEECGNAIVDNHDSAANGSETTAGSFAHNDIIGDESTEHEDERSEGSNDCGDETGSLGSYSFSP